MPVKQEHSISPLRSSEKKKRVTFITSKARKSHKSSMVLSSGVGLNKSDYYSKMRNSIFNKHKKSRDKLHRTGKAHSNAPREERDASYTSKILEKRRRALQKNLSAQKLKSQKKNVSFKRSASKVDESSLLMGYSRHNIYPKIQGKKRRYIKESNSSYNNVVSRNLSRLNQSQSSNNLNFLGRKKFEENSKMLESIKKGYSKGFHKSKAFLMTSENFINFKKRKNVLERSPMQKSGKSSKKYSRERVQPKSRKVNRSLHAKGKHSGQSKVRDA